MSNGTSEFVDRSQLLELQARFATDPQDEGARDVRDRVAARLLRLRGFTVRNGMVVDKTGPTPQVMPVIVKARRVVALALELLDA